MGIILPKKSTILGNQKNKVMETNTGKITTLGITIVALYLVAKNYKSTEFWAGMMALFLLGTSVKTYNK